ncbi:MAG: DegQ family serine endoprotease [Gammaproteobacteria bacterium]|nr:DegQ family serine endoprotease [Gammaproteobacteria bacterium]
MIRRFSVIALFFIVSVHAHAGLPLSDSQGKALPSLAPMLEKATPAVVNINTSSKVRIQNNPLLDDPFFRHFFDIPERPQERTNQSLGSGVIVDAKKGYILTNNHVIHKADEIHVTLRDGRRFQAKLVGTDPETDVAVIQIDADKLTALGFANSDQIRVGDFAVAIGNPFGLGQTVTSGIISALGRSGLGIEGYEDFIQTDASINPGNSGGALVNLSGELIGINTAIFSQSGGNIGIGFAIPINMAQDVMGQLIKHGEVHRGVLGIQAQDLTPDLAQAFNIDKRHHQGAVITSITKDSAAQKSGLRVGDIIVEANGRAINSSANVRNIVGLLRIGEKIHFKILRNGKQMSMTAVVAEQKQHSVDGGTFSKRLAGASISNIESGHPYYGHIEGLVILSVAPGSPAAGVGLRKGDVITSVNKQAVKEVADIKAAIKRSKRLLLNVRRGNGAFFVIID